MLDPIQRAQLQQYENQQAQGGPQIPGYVNGQAQMGHVNPTRGNMPFMQAAADAGQDPTSYDTMHGGSGAVRKDIFDEAIQPQAILSPSGRGFKSSTPEAKDFIYQKIQQKKGKNMPLSDKEKKFEEEYMFGKPGKSGEGKTIDNKKILDVAKDLAKSANQLGGYESPTIEQIQEQMPNARRLLEEGTLGESGQAGQAGASSLPPEVDTPDYWKNLGISGEEDAKRHLVETYSLTEDEAIQWLMGD